jgi:spermidine synthase
VRIIPGDGVNLYLASNDSELEKVTPEEMVKRLEKMSIQTNLFTKSYLEFRLHERWVKWFLESLKDRKVNINSDFRPISVYLSLSYWNALFSPYLMEIFKRFERFSIRIFIAFIFLFTLLLTIFLIKNPRLSWQSLPYSIFTTGLGGMIFNLAIIFTFQTFYGYLYHQIGLLIAIFMFGVALSSFYMTRRLDRIGGDSSLFLKIEAAIILFSFLFPFIFIIPSQYAGKTFASYLVYIVFLIMSFLSGSSIGLQFPLATKIYLNRPSRRVRLGYTAGMLYGADLMGGFLGGLFGGILLLPILGLKESCFLMGLIKASSMALFLIFVKINKIGYGRLFY